MQGKANTLRVLSIILDNLGIVTKDDAYRLLSLLHQLLEISMSEAFNDNLINRYQVLIKQYYQIRSKLNTIMPDPGPLEVYKWPTPFLKVIINSLSH